MQLSDTVALVTGGASGLGRATAELLVDRGASVITMDIDDAESVSPSHYHVVGDVTQEADVQRAIDDAQTRFGGLRVAVNCAGIGGGRRLVNLKGPMSLDMFREIVEVNLIGTFNVLRLAASAISVAPLIDGERGVVINTSSIAAYDGQVGQVAYAASKAGIIGLTLPAARDMAQRQVRVVTVAPGIFDTALVGKLSEKAQESVRRTVLHPSRLGRPAEYAHLIATIVENPMLNGETIRLDGGARLGFE